MYAALSSQKQNSDDGIYVIKTGVDNATLTGQIESWNGSPTLSTWSDDPCNLINGTNIPLLSPNLTTKDTVYGFNSDICR